MTKSRIELGQWGETLAYTELIRVGYKVVAQNYRCKLGEIDIIAEDGGVLVFIEIKTRYNVETSIVKEAVNIRKQHQISRVALNYMKDNDFMDRRARFDVVAISLKGNEPYIEIIENAFDFEI